MGTATDIFEGPENTGDIDGANERLRLQDLPLASTGTLHSHLRLHWFGAWQNAPLAATAPCGTKPPPLPIAAQRTSQWLVDWGPACFRW